MKTLPSTESTPNPPALVTKPPTPPLGSLEVTFDLLPNHDVNHCDFSKLMSADCQSQCHQLSFLEDRDTLIARYSVA